MDSLIIRRGYSVKMSRTSKAAKLNMISTLASFLDSGAGAATLIFYDDTIPADIETAADDAAKLVTLTLPEPCFKAVTADYIELYPPLPAMPIKTGTATWARLFNGAGQTVQDLAVGTDIILSKTAITLGGEVSIQSIKLRP